MPARKCEIRVTADSVDVESGLFGTKLGRFSFGTLLVAGSSWLAYPTLLRTGGSGDRVPLGISLVISIAFLLLGIRYFLPFGERLHCDRTRLTWSRVRWGIRWITRSVPFSEVVGASYAIVYESKSVHGLVLETYDENWKTFWGIEAPEANRILTGLKKLGVNVHHDPEMRHSIRETLRDRRAQL